MALGTRIIRLSIVYYIKFHDSFSHKVGVRSKLLSTSFLTFV